MFDLIPFDRRTKKIFNFPFESIINFDDELRSFKSDIKETEGSFIIEADLPGMKKDDINIDLNDDYLTISASNKIEKEEKKGKYIHRERKVGEFSRKFLVNNISIDEIKASYKDGVLKVILPKDVTKSNKKIIIE